jgi:ribosomal protein L18E
MKLQVKAVELTAQKVKTIQDCGGEAMKMTKHMPPVR